MEVNSNAYQSEADGHAECVTVHHLAETAGLGSYLFL